MCFYDVDSGDLWIVEDNGYFDIRSLLNFVGWMVLNVVAHCSIGCCWILMDTECCWLDVTCGC